jgi:hypothetical protein
MLPGFNTSQSVGAQKRVFKSALSRLVGLGMALVGMLPHWILSEFALRLGAFGLANGCKETLQSSLTGH